MLQSRDCPRVMLIFPPLPIGYVYPLGRTALKPGALINDFSKRLEVRPTAENYLENTNTITNFRSSRLHCTSRNLKLPPMKALNRLGSFRKCGPKYANP